VDLKTLADDITMTYAFWLTGANTADWAKRANAVLGAISARNPRLHLGLQVSHKNQKTARPGRVLLEIETLEIALKGLRF